MNNKSLNNKLMNALNNKSSFNLKRSFYFTGMCVTAVTIVLVGCRMRTVRRRMRRGGKSAYAHDADFLVNGMYL